MTVEELARLKFYEAQHLDPDSVPEGRLTWEECVELADSEHPLHDHVYEFMYQEAMLTAIAECN